RMPTARQVEKWRAEGPSLRWAVKVYRGVTHFGRLSEKALELLRRFLALFEPMDHLVDFYLFQMPPFFTNTSRNRARVERIASALGPRAAIRVP
ncbi:DUF72 domain-containing protein, partial [Pyrobaculum sp.]|uniref:DUF72 domain-containing protein n=1 Tax=Pyrobaculum sp. TaxID=2004705 RepID=UPI0038620C09